MSSVLANETRVIEMLVNDRYKFMLQSMMQRGEATVAEIVEDSQTKGGCLATPASSIYPVFRRFEAIGLIEHVRSDATQAGRPRMYYRVTSFGALCLEAYLAETLPLLRSP